MKHLKMVDSRIPASRERDRTKRRNARWTTVATIPALLCAWLVIGWLEQPTPPAPVTRLETRTPTVPPVSTVPICLLADSARPQVATPIATCPKRYLA